MPAVRQWLLTDISFDPMILTILQCILHNRIKCCVAYMKARKQFSRQSGERVL